MKNNSLKKKIIFCLLITIEIILATTFLGSIPLFGPVVATTVMIPVIIASLGLSVYYGFFSGLIFGFLSFLVWTFMPPNPIIAFLFTPLYQSANFQGNIYSLVICFIPRILTGILPIILFGILNVFLNEKISLVISSCIGSITNTLFTVLFMGVFFSSQIEEALKLPFSTFFSTTVLFNGIPEAILCGIICPLVIYILKKYLLS